VKHVVSLSLGTSLRNKTLETQILGEDFKIERIGYDGDMKAYAQAFKDYDGKVDALGVGGADVYLWLAGRKYAFKEILNIVKQVKITPVVDGSGLKHSLERETVKSLQADGVVDFAHSRVLVVSAVDRFGMSEALEETGAKVTYGDLLFGIGVDIPLRKYTSVKSFGKVMLPVITQLPFKWFYPTGKQQEIRKPKFAHEFKNADVIAGDWHYIHRYMPDSLPGKTILTQTLRFADLEFLTNAKVARAITTTPMMGGETFATNVMEAVIVAHLGRKPEDLNENDYLKVLKELDWKPNVIPLGEAVSVPSPS